MGLSVWGSPNWFVSGTDLTGSRCGGGHREGTRCARCVFLCQGEAGTHTAHLGAHPHTQRSHAHIRSDPLTHTPSHMCPNTVAHTPSDTTPLTYSDRLLHAQMPSRLHTQCSHTLSNTHTPEHHHTHMLVCFTLTRGHFMHKHDHPRSSATTPTLAFAHVHTHPLTCTQELPQSHPLHSLVPVEAPAHPRYSHSHTQAPSHSEIHCLLHTDTENGHTTHRPPPSPPVST